MNYSALASGVAAFAISAVIVFLTAAAVAGCMTHIRGTDVPRRVAGVIVAVVLVIVAVVAVVVTIGALL